MVVARVNLKKEVAISVISGSSESIKESKDPILDCLVPSKKVFPVNVFEACWERESYTGSSVGVGYIGSTRMCLAETQEDALYLSRILGGCLVKGIHNQNLGICCISCVGLAAVAHMQQIWDDFFNKNPYGRFVQYCFAQGARVVQAALNSSIHSKQVTVVAINPTISISHSSLYCFCSQGQAGFFGANRADILDWHSDAGGILSLRFTDPTFQIALRSAYLDITGIKLNAAIDVFEVPQDVVSFINLSAKDHKIYPSMLTRKDHPEIFDRAFALTETSTNAQCHADFLPDVKLDILVNAALAALRVIDYSTNLFLGRLNRQQASHDYAVRPNATGHLPNGSYPQSIYPCQVASDGAFPDGSHPFGNFVQEVGKYFYYIDFMSGSPNYTDAGFYPCGITPEGVFPDGTSPYRDLVDFSLVRFFAGDYIPSRALGSLPNAANFPSIYPGNILPNGTFLNSDYPHPYGYYPQDDFPYDRYFFGQFNYEGSFVRNLPIYLKNQTSYDIYRRDYFQRMEESEFEMLSMGSLDLFWAIYTGAQLILLSCQGKKHRKIRAVALGISSTGFLANVFDLVNGLGTGVSSSGFFSSSIQATLCLYAGASLLKDTIYYSLPRVRQQIYNFAFSNQEIDVYEVLGKVGRHFHKNLRNIRAFTALFMVALMSNSFLVGRLMRNDSSAPVVYGIHDLIHTLFITIVLPITTMLLFGSSPSYED